ncbi:hypothetical protein [Tolypothrix sp. NIES-4075]|uniref:hypothetical protein n=1 Tax=Tolypothrix sp. NIES-4075 TaxID=2005459 RepID=UPI00135A7B5B|nr:hypothetical protein [Tolypothrix sp. NIES-4075]
MIYNFHQKTLSEPYWIATKIKDVVTNIQAIATKIKDVVTNIQAITTKIKA